MKRTLILFFSLTIFTSEIAVAQSPSTKPDWKNREITSINLSGISITFDTPAKLSNRYPQTNISSANLYDNETFDNDFFLEILQKHWDYKRHIIFIEDFYGSLHMHMGAIKSKTVVTQDNFQNILVEHSLFTYAPLFPDAANFVKDFKPVVINNTQWLTFTESLPSPNGSKSVYSTILTKNHYLSISFDISESKERHNADWYATALSDIEKIMNSFEIKQAQEN